MRHYPSHYRNRYRDSMPNIRQNSRNTVKKGEEVLKNPVVSKIPQGIIQNQQTWAHRDSQILHGTDIGPPPIYYICVV